MGTKDLNMASALNVYSEVNIEEEMNQPYVEQFKLQMKEKLVEAIHFLSRRTGGIEANRCPAKLMEMVMRTMTKFDDNIYLPNKAEDCRESRGIQPFFPDTDFVDIQRGNEIRQMKAKIQNLKEENKTLQEDKENEVVKRREIQVEKETLQRQIETLQRDKDNDRFEFWNERFTLKEENINLSNKILYLRDLLDSYIKCKLCLAKELQVVYEPCNHVVSCQECAKKINNICPFCRTGITNIKKIFLA